MDDCALRNVTGLEQGGRAQGVGVKLTVHGHESAVGLVRAQHNESVWRSTFKALRHQAGSGVRGRQGIGVFVVFDEREILRSGKIERRNIRNQVRKSRGVTGFGSRQ
jgi:hypothetical protein